MKLRNAKIGRRRKKGTFSDWMALMVKEGVLLEGIALSGIPEMPLGFSSLPLVKEEAMVEAAAVLVAIVALNFLLLITIPSLFCFCSFS